MKKNNLLAGFIMAVAMTGILFSGCNHQQNENGGTDSSDPDFVECIEPGGDENFYATWASAQYEADSTNQPPLTLSGNSLRQIIHTSVGGEKIRIKFSNLVGQSDLSIKSAHIAKTVSKSQIDTDTDTIISFNGGSTSCTISAGKELYSDLLNFSFDDLDCLTVTIYFDQVPSNLTGHMGSRTTSYIMKGNHVSDETFSSTYTCEHWYVLAEIDVCSSTEIRAVSCLGDSITDGRGSTTDSQNRWTDILAEQLISNDSTKNVSVINEGIGATSVTSSGVSRFNRDVLKISGVYYAVMLYGINDIIYANASSTTIINTYKNLIKKAHNNDVIIYGCTILPFGGCSDYSDSRNAVRLAVNDWIKNTSAADGGFDGVIDFASLMAATDNSDKMDSVYDSGDGLHPGAAGYKAMGKYISTSLFTKNKSDYSGNWPKSSGSVNVQDIELFKYALPQTVAAGEEVAICVKGTSNGTQGFRVWLTDSSNGDKSNIVKYENSGDFELNEILTAKSSSGYLLFKGITYGTNIEDLTLNYISVTIDDITTKIDAESEIIK